MADVASEPKNQSSKASEKDLDTSDYQATTGGDDSVFYSEGEKIPQQVLDSIWAPRSGEPTWPEKLGSAPQIHVTEARAACHAVEIREAGGEELAEELSMHQGTNPAGAAQTKEEDDSRIALPDGSGESGETGLPEESSVSAEDGEEEHGPGMMCHPDHKPFNHLSHAKYGTVSYRRIKRGQTRKRIEMFESMMQL